MAQKTSHFVATSFHMQRNTLPYTVAQINDCGLCEVIGCWQEINLEHLATSAMFSLNLSGKSKNTIDEVFPYKTSMGTRQIRKVFVNFLCAILIESISTISFPVRQ